MCVYVYVQCILKELCETERRSQNSNNIWNFGAGIKMNSNEEGVWILYAFSRANEDEEAKEMA